MSEWLDIMLAEIARKRTEDRAARDEHARRRSGVDDPGDAGAGDPGGDSSGGQGRRASGRAGAGPSK